MGTTASPLGKRLILPMKISTTWFSLKAVTVLFGETTGTTSAEAAPQLNQRAKPIKPDFLLKEYMVRISLKHKIERGTEHLEITARPKARLEVIQSARRAIADTAVVVLQL